MRFQNYYNIIFCDVDDTLIYGFWTDLMRVTWNMFHSPRLSNVLTFIQEKLKIYRVNRKLQFILSNAKADIIFLTARGENDSTADMIRNILPNTDFTLMELGTEEPHFDKLEEARYAIQEYSEKYEMTPRCCIFDDNKKVRDIFNHWHIDAFDPTSFIAKLEG